MSRFYLSLTDDQGTLLDRNFIDVDRPFLVGPDNCKISEPRTLEQALEFIGQFGFSDSE